MRDGNAKLTIETAATAMSDDWNRCMHEHLYFPAHCTDAAQPRVVIAEPVRCAAILRPAYQT